jgi:hypothetical protein
MQKAEFPKAQHTLENAYFHPISVPVAFLLSEFSGVTANPFTGSIALHAVKHGRGRKVADGPAQAWGLGQPCHGRFAQPFTSGRERQKLGCENFLESLGSFGKLLLQSFHVFGDLLQLFLGGLVDGGQSTRVMMRLLVRFAERFSDSLGDLGDSIFFCHGVPPPKRTHMLPHSGGRKDTGISGDFRANWTSADGRRGPFSLLRSLSRKEGNSRILW